VSKIIEIIVSPQGETKVHTKGFTGGECREASKFIEEALGTRTGEQVTGEFYQQVTQQQSLREGA